MRLFLVRNYWSKFGSQNYWWDIFRNYRACKCFCHAINLQLKNLKYGPVTWIITLKYMVEGFKDWMPETEFTDNVIFRQKLAKCPHGVCWNYSDTPHSPLRNRFNTSMFLVGWTTLRPSISHLIYWHPKLRN